jgi:N-acetyl-gamma-glutamyl-phosphate reductase
MIRVGIVGGTGYTGVELMRLLATHPVAEIVLVTSRTETGNKVCDLFPSLRNVIDLEFSDPDVVDYVGCDVIFTATPSGVAMTQAVSFLNQGIRLIDLSADFRLADALVWERWYGKPHVCPDLLEEAVYGLPEVHRDRIVDARLVANPGCYPTAVQLGFLPLIESGVADLSCLVADAKSGVSGAGRSTSIATQFSEASDSLKAYSVPGHRHFPEICQGLDAVAGSAVGLTFVPHLVPMIRGIHATLYARLTDSGINLTDLYNARYEDEPFVDVMKEGSHPDTKSVRGTNLLRIACHRPQQGDLAVILVVEDNMVKGACGQAVQNMNLMFGMPEVMGLTATALAP